MPVPVKTKPSAPRSYALRMLAEGSRFCLPPMPWGGDGARGMLVGMVGPDAKVWLASTGQTVYWAGTTQVLLDRGDDKAPTIESLQARAYAPPPTMKQRETRAIVARAKVTAPTTTPSTSLGEEI